MLLHKIKYILAITLLLGSSLAIIGTANAASAAQGDACSGLNQLNGDPASTTCPDGSSSVSNLIATIVNILSLIVGIAAVIMIIVGGLKYVTANGDSNNLNSAKNTIIFALVGLVVAAFAQMLVHFVLTKAAPPATTTGTFITTSTGLPYK